MFLYDNNIVSENYLTVEPEPTVDFYTEAVECNKALLTESMGATKYMIDVIAEYGDSANIVTEAFSEWKDKIIKFLKEFKAKVIVLFRRWIDWLAKKLNMKGRYGDEAMNTLLRDTAKCAALADFSMELPEPTDFGFIYFNELDVATFPTSLDKMVDNIRKTGIDDNEEYDAKKIRDQLANETQSYLNGTKLSVLTIKDMRQLFNIKQSASKNLDNYKNKVIDAINHVTVASHVIGGSYKTSTKTINPQDQKVYEYLVTIASCLGDHLTKMSNEYATYINRIDQAITSFLPQAEQYLLAK